MARCVFIHATRSMCVSGLAFACTFVQCTSGWPYVFSMEGKRGAGPLTLSFVAPLHRGQWIVAVLHVGELVLHPLLKRLAPVTRRLTRGSNPWSRRSHAQPPDLTFNRQAWSSGSV
jgi:hypothetical protein